MNVRTLEAPHIIGTIERPDHRMRERFPGAGLPGAGRDLFGLARDGARDAELLGRPNWPVRALIAAALLLLTGPHLRPLPQGTAHARTAVALAVGVTSA